MKSIKPIKLLLGIFISNQVFAQPEISPRPEKPNIVFILADDLGWQDVKCYDIDEPSAMETPSKGSENSCSWRCTTNS